MEDTEDENKCNFSKVCTNPMQNPAELGNVRTRELEFPKI